MNFALKMQFFHVGNLFKCLFLSVLCIISVVM